MWLLLIILCSRSRCCEISRTETRNERERENVTRYEASAAKIYFHLNEHIFVLVKHSFPATEPWKGGIIFTRTTHTGCSRGKVSMCWRRQWGGSVVLGRQTSLSSQPSCSCLCSELGSSSDLSRFDCLSVGPRKFNLLLNHVFVSRLHKSDFGPLTVDPCREQFYHSEVQDWVTVCAVYQQTHNDVGNLGVWLASTQYNWQCNSLEKTRKLFTIFWDTINIHIKWNCTNIRAKIRWQSN